MKGIIQRVLLFLIIVIALYSCTSLGKIGIQIAVPPKYPVPSEIQSVAILNRSLTPKFTNLGRDSLEKILVNHDLDIDTIFHDSIAADTAIQVAAKALFESGRFDVVVPEQRNIMREDKDGVLSPLDQGFIESICKNFSTDGVLVLEDFSEQLTTDFSRTRLNTFDYSRSLNEYNGVINVLYKAIWRLYQPILTPPILKFEAIDSIFWNSREYSLQRMYNQLPSVKEALIGGGIASAMDIAKDISPTWKDEVRKFFITGNKEIDTAIPLFKGNKWEEAAEILMKYSTVSSKSLRSRIEFNLALTSEMTGDIDLAIDWVTKSYKTKFSQAADLYLKSLIDRRKILRKISGNL